MHARMVTTWWPRSSVRKKESNIQMLQEILELAFYLTKADKPDQAI